MNAGGLRNFVLCALVIISTLAITHRSTMPADPWEGNGKKLVAHGPTMPPDPWEGTRKPARG